jgi:hypothetical protein
MLKPKGHPEAQEATPASSADNRDTSPETVCKGNDETTLQI